MVAHGFVKEIPHAYPIYKHKYVEDFSKINQKLNRIALYIDSRSKDCKITKTELFAVRKIFVELRHNPPNMIFGTNPVKGMWKIKRGKGFAGIVQLH